MRRTFISEKVNVVLPNAGEAELRPRLPISAYDVYTRALKRLENIDSGEKKAPTLWRASRFRDALMVGLLIATTLRLRTFVAIDIEKHLSASQNGFLLSFGPADKKAHEFELPTQLVEALRRYLMEFRQLQLGGNSSSRLCSRIGADPAPMTASSIAWRDSLARSSAWLSTLMPFGVLRPPRSLRRTPSTSTSSPTS